MIIMMLPKYICFEIKADGNDIYIDEIDYHKLIEQETNYGYWQRVNDRYSYWFQCSNCGLTPLCDRWGHECKSPYCPHCGKEMEFIDKDGNEIE